MCSSPVEAGVESWLAAMEQGLATADLPGEDDLVDEQRDAAWQQVTADRVAEQAARVATTVGDDDAPADLAALVALVAADPASLDADTRLAWLAAVARTQAWLNARLDDGVLAVAGPATRLVAEARARDDQRCRPSVLVDPEREEVALALRVTSAVADRRITTARRLAALLPQTREALRAGRIDPRRAAVVADAAGDLLRGLPDAADPTGASTDPDLVPAAVDVCSRLEARVLPRAAGQTLTSLRRSCARAVHRLDPAGALARARAAQRQRDVWVTPLPDGQAILSARLDAATAATCKRRVRAAAEQLRQQALASGHADDGTRAGEWRAEAAAALLQHGRVDWLPDPDVALGLVIDLPTLLGLADNPAQLEDGEPLAAQQARELISRAGRVWVRRLVTDPVTGHLLDYGRTRYRLPARLAAYVAARDRTCRFPCCDHRAAGNGVDLDHAVPYDDGGATSAANTGPLHRRHHRLVTHHGWRISPLRSDGSVEVVSPLGKRHARPPTPQLEGSLPDPGPPEYQAPT